MADPKPHLTEYAAVIEPMAALSRRVNNTEAATGTQRARATAKQPLLDADTTTVRYFGLSPGWNTYASINLPVPKGKSTAIVVANATGALVDLTTGGAAYLTARLVIADSASSETHGSKATGASAVNNIFNISRAIKKDKVSGTITIFVEIHAYNTAAFPPNPGNFIDLTVHASFAN